MEKKKNGIRWFRIKAIILTSISLCFHQPNGVMVFIVYIQKVPQKVLQTKKKHWLK